jgi:hypothetical protein
MRPVRASLAFVALVAALALAPFALTTRAQEGHVGSHYGPPPDPIDVDGKAWVAALDEVTGVITLAQGEPGSGQVVVLDLAGARAGVRPLSKDVGGGVVPVPFPIPPAMGPVVWTWAPVKGHPLGILNTTSGQHHVLDGSPTDGGKVWSTNLRWSATRASRDLQVARSK